MTVSSGMIHFYSKYLWQLRYFCGTFLRLCNMFSWGRVGGMEGGKERETETETERDRDREQDRERRERERQRPVPCHVPWTCRPELCCACIIHRESICYLWVWFKSESLGPKALDFGFSTLTLHWNAPFVAEQPTMERRITCLQKQPKSVSWNVTSPSLVRTNTEARPALWAVKGSDPRTRSVYTLLSYTLLHKAWQ